MSKYVFCQNIKLIGTGSAAEWDGVNWDTEHGGAAILPVLIFDVPSTGVKWL
jgi:hypothetical protein